MSGAIAGTDLCKVMADTRERDELGRSHPKFKAFAGEVEACLQLFERSKEWSDYVSALSKLIKVCLNVKRFQDACTSMSLRCS